MNMLTKRLGRIRCIIISLTLLSACGPEPVSDLAYAARVRVQARQLGKGWHTGSIGTLANSCMTVMVGDPPDAPVRFDAVDFADVDELLVSDRFDGRPGPDGTVRKWAPGADTTREEWRKVDLGAIREKHGNCSRG
ncbi:MAG TPA: hypothetical protein VGB24_09240 [Longimicrobium sp.]|jgi:hypothetical protein|uniref:hypothetical protein n=1 Tax=Longimicrobium sp. TaxID=2029185 RepID=UPI002ED8E854